MSSTDQQTDCQELEAALDAAIHDFDKASQVVRDRTAALQACRKKAAAIEPQIQQIGAG